MVSTPAANPDPAPRPVLVAACASVAFAALWLGVRVGDRLVDAEELHALLAARRLLAGDVLPPWLGSLTPYEGGSWWFAWPVAGALALGLEGSAATSAVGAALALVGVGAASLWAGRAGGWPAALAVGPLFALATPAFTSFATIGTGGTPDALFVLPVLALGFGGWVRRGRPLGGAAGLGVVLGAAIVLSYVHLATALAFAGVQVVEARGAARRRALETGVAVAAALAVVGAWHWLMAGLKWSLPTVRDGMPLADAGVLLPRVDRVLADAPAAWLGALGQPDPAPLAGGALLTLLVAAAAVAGWRSGDASRRGAVAALVVFTVAVAGAYGLAHDAADIPRYFLPLFGIGLVLVATWHPAASAGAVLCGVLLLAPAAHPGPSQWPDRAHLRLGMLYLEAREPAPTMHAKFERFVPVTHPAHRGALAFGYGLRMGARCRTQRNSHPLVSWGGRTFRGPTPWSDPAGLTGLPRTDYLVALGAGLALDGKLSPTEAEVVFAARERDRAALAEGVGAGLAAGGYGVDDARARLVEGGCASTCLDAFVQGVSQRDPVRDGRLAFLAPEVRGLP